jgi:hypothetical protein
VIVILVTSVSSLATVVAPILRIVGWESTKRAVNEGIGSRMDERLPGSAFGSSYCSVVRDICCEGPASPNALTDGEMGPRRRLELSDADDVIAVRDWAEFADRREELEPERLKAGSRRCRCRS